MSHHTLKGARIIASAEEGSETDVESGNANDHNEAAYFWEAFKRDQPPNNDEQIAEKPMRIHRSRTWSFLRALAPWTLSLVFFIAFISERLQSKYLCSGDVAAQYILAEDQIGGQPQSSVCILRVAKCREGQAMGSV